MTIFHVIKYRVADICEREQLDQLPKEVVSKWQARLVEYAIHQAEAVAYAQTAWAARAASAAWAAKNNVVDWNDEAAKIDAAAKDLFHKWLIEELNNYEMTS